MKIIDLPIFGFLVHIFLLVAICLSIFQYYESWQINTQIEKSKNTIAIIQENIDNLRSPNNFLNSDDYKEKISRDANLKIEGEYIIDTSGLEDVEQEISNFIPSQGVDKKSNLEKWWFCFFSPLRNQCIK